jgi:hypothetical protein
VGIKKANKKATITVMVPVISAFSGKWVVTKEINLANNLLSMFNHSLLKGDDFYEDKIKEINVPSLVIHGTEDKEGLQSEQPNL